MKKFKLKGDEKILLIRTDRIGDVLMSLPSVYVLKKAFPMASISMLVSDYAAPVLENAKELAETICIDSEERRGPMFIRRLARRLKAEAFDIAVMLRPVPAETLAIFLARIPVRIGTKYRAYSVFINAGVATHRRPSEKSEAAYVLDMLSPLGIKDVPLDEALYPRIVLLPNETERARRELNDLGIDPGRPLAVIHPGGRGSSPRWPPKKFAELADFLTDKAGVNVLITGGPGEGELVAYAGRLCRSKVFQMAESRNLRVFAGMLSLARLFVGNSSGPLHMAAAVGTPVIGLYSPLRAASPTRWGPLSRNARCFTPPLETCEKCTGKDCEYYSCMDRIPVEPVADAAYEMVESQLRVLH